MASRAGSTSSMGSWGTSNHFQRFVLEHKLDWELHCHICFLSGTISGRNYCEHPIPELSGHFGRILNTKQKFEVRLSEVAVNGPVIIA